MSLEGVNKTKANIGILYKKNSCQNERSSAQFFTAKFDIVMSNNITPTTVFENHRKSLIQDCERSELRLHFEWTKVNEKCQKCSILACFWKPEACGQTVLPDRSILIWQKLVKNA